MQRNSVKLPWWFWLAATGALSFVPLFVIGNKLKNWLWVGLASWQLVWLWLWVEPEPESTDAFDAFMWFSIIIAIYVFTVVRKQYVIELEIDRAANLSQEEPSENTLQNTLQNTPQLIKVWSCTGCGAENHNPSGVCEYCGLAVK